MEKQGNFLLSSSSQSATSSIDHKNATFICSLLAIAFLLPLLLPITSYANSPVREINAVTERISAITSEWEERRNINLDPRANEQIANEFFHFIQVFGYDYSGSTPTEKPPVLALLHDNQRLRQVIHGYLDDAISQAKIQSIMDRMANIFGKSSQHAGWPAHVANSFRHVDFSSQLPKEKITLTSDGMEDAPSYFTRFLILPGKHKLSDARNSWEFEIDPPKAGDSLKKGNYSR